ncbi:hypothetical protein SARC_06611 [Sphaeroforma arctica JP610]|uniref:RGS domain-containing protein n=1 Tax=Sphaeroforma arctica JP610 TaxID=667725 RepID=A0A0L0FWW5_9EUKA|nr:hypothetical protein SARC_06611 [Sphaeroforma arctica JP610]KNC81051.1 hypothetical protein SARC_06611 [Sphaeroforma arctica JP610]|eukprot:XP_014154953.1 hypothetical protein SARC_06611 [Sphaeroforma arctica JP610]
MADLFVSSDNVTAMSAVPLQENMSEVSKKPSRKETTAELNRELLAGQNAVGSTILSMDKVEEDSTEDLNVQYNKRAAQIRRTSNIYSWALSILVYPLIFGLAVCFFFLVKQQANDLMEIIMNGRDVYIIVVSVIVPTIFALLALIAFFAFFWKEPEVRSRHHGFIINYCACALCLEVSVLISASIIMQITSIKAITATGMNDTWLSLVGFWLITLVNFFALNMIVPVVARMRYINELYVHRNRFASYWGVPIIYLVLYFLTAFMSMAICEYAVDPTTPCTATEKFSGTIVFVAIHNVHYFYLVWSAWGAKDYFIDFVGNVRMYMIFFVGTWAAIAYGIVSDNPADIWYLWFFETWFKLWVIGIENFGFIIVRVLGRKITKGSSLRGLDLEGEHFREGENRKGVVNLLRIPETADLFLAQVKKMHAEENILFLRSVLDCNNNRDDASVVRAIVDEFIVADSPQEVNITAPVREKTLKKLNTGDYYDSKALFDDAFMEVSILVTRNSLPAFLNSSEYMAWCAERDEHDHLIALLRKNSLMDAAYR